MTKNKILMLLLITLFLSPLTVGSYLNGQPPKELAITEEKNSFNPIVKPEATMDKNNNKIHDHLESLLKGGLKGSYYKTIVTFDQPITGELISRIEAIGGQVLTTWSVIYGAAVKIPARNINSLARLPEITFITENYRSKALLSTSVKQINVRPYVWDTLGYEGSSGHAIAILDTGIDDSHSDLSGKIVHWEDYVGHDADASGDTYASATDWGAHGTHCSSIAAGTGAAGGMSSTIEVTGTIGLQQLEAGSGMINHAEVETSGSIQIEVQWDDKTGNSPSDTMFVALDSNNDGSITGADDVVSADYGSPLVLNSGVLSPGKYMFLIGPWDAGEIYEGTTVQYKITRPAASSSDSHNKYRGVAPGCKLVGLKVLDDTGAGYQDQFLDGLDWVSNHGKDYDVVVCSMSLGFDSPISAIDTAVNNLVSQGFVCIAAAGNAYPDSYIGSPGTASKAITVGAIDDVDKIAIYSSNGSPSHWKPDVVAPGGAYTDPIGANEDTHPIVAADSNDYDIVTINSFDPVVNYWETEMNANDYIAYQGTSMATPHVAGLAALIIQAMGADWDGTEAAALKVKNYLCGTATEVIEGEGVGGTYNTPSLNRGDSDRVEGFGKVHGDAAIEAFLSTYTPGSIITESLSDSPMGKQCWARRVELQASIEFTAGIEMDGTADYDLYLYDPSQDMTDYLGYLTKSTNSGYGTPENIVYTPASSMTAYLVIKRVQGYGQFTLQAEATKTGTPITSGNGNGTDFSFSFGIPTLIWAILSTVGLTSLLFVLKKKK
ncbi:MAG: S8 family serine peptidase [Candidatus Heimdallarchaeota archaeon]|nr:S8 family serine peptidase [Candidatus Heimdallarchaeota archaeon]